MPYNFRSSPRRPNSDHSPSIPDQGSSTLTSRPLPLSIPDQGRPSRYRPMTQFRPLTSRTNPTTKVPSLPPILQLPPQLN